MHATNNAAIITTAATPDSHPDCRAFLTQIVAPHRIEYRNWLPARQSRLRKIFPTCRPKVRLLPLLQPLAITNRPHFLESDQTPSHTRITERQRACPLICECAPSCRGSWGAAYGSGTGGPPRAQLRQHVERLVLRRWLRRPVASETDTCSRYPSEKGFRECFSRLHAADTARTPGWHHGTNLPLPR